MSGQLVEAQVHHWLVLLIFALAALVFILLMRVNAPYGRFLRAGWGPTIPAKTAWVIFESPAVILFAVVYFAGRNALELAPLVLLGIWQFHYIVRTVVFPLRIQGSGKRIPLVVVVTAIGFNVVNAYINARWVSDLGSYPDDWLLSAPFLIGVTMFVGGWIVNQRADRVLSNLRQPGESHYSVPRGGLYRYVSCPNYLGEMLEWLGWAVLTWSLAGAAFAAFTIANLLPRAIATHRWYQDTFPDYPDSRKAVIPFVV